MKLGLAIRELHRSESALARDLVAVADRHQVEHEVHHVANDLLRWSHGHLHELAAAGTSFGLRLRADIGTSRLAPARRSLSRLAVHRSTPGILLLADLRRLHRKAAGVSLDWELLAQGAQVAGDGDLLALAQRCHPQTLRQLTWANSMLKVLSPQVLAS
ncbi:hypothetical protein [Actinokineospora pegani]|uniref:hypothetical protein n=1 Tax=Actinokineospora pegani TaxID=2654637 RepID=UPI0012EAE060|nr:hypothetical protein [Actinokineospora pegani]